MIVSCREFMPVVRAALERGQRVRMTANGGSMFPFIHDGDVVELEPINLLPKKGDIVLLQCSEDRYALHRVARLKNEALFFRGDLQQHSCGPFTPRVVFGKVTLSQRNGYTRALDRGVWRLAGLMWIWCAPLGLLLFRMVRRSRTIGGKLLRHWHRFSPIE